MSKIIVSIFKYLKEIFFFKLDIFGDFKTLYGMFLLFLWPLKPHETLCEASMMTKVVHNEMSNDIYLAFS